MKRKLEDQNGEVFEETMYVNGQLVSAADAEEEDENAPDDQTER